MELLDITVEAGSTINSFNFSFPKVNGVQFQGIEIVDIDMSVLINSFNLPKVQILIKKLFCIENINNSL